MIFKAFTLSRTQEKDVKGGMERANAALALGYFVARLIPKQHDELTGSAFSWF